MAALPRVRQIEETLRQAQLDPRLISVITAIAERQRVQHQQLYQMASLIVAMQDLIKQLIEKMGVRDANLNKLGVQEMLKNMQNQSKPGALVESVEDFDQQIKSTPDTLKN